MDDGRNYKELSTFVDDDGPVAPDISSADVAHGTPEFLAGVDARNTTTLGSRAHVTEFLASTRGAVNVRTCLGRLRRREVHSGVVDTDSTPDDQIITPLEEF